MREYTPTTDEVRAVSTGGNPWQEARFDRWLSAECARAWDEGFTRGFYDPLAGGSRDASESVAENPYENGETDE